MCVRECVSLSLAGLSSAASAMKQPKRKKKTERLQRATYVSEENSTVTMETWVLTDLYSNCGE